MLHDKEEFFTRDGRHVSETEALDDDGCLRDGYGMRQPLYMMDSLQRSIARDGTDEEEPEEEETRRRKRKHTRPDLAAMGDAAVGFTDSRGVYFPPDQRMVDAQRATEYMRGRDEALRQRWLDGRRAVNEARDGMVRDSQGAWRPCDAAPRTDVRRPVSLADARRIRDEAHAAHVREGEQAWRRANERTQNV